MDTCQSLSSTDKKCFFVERPIKIVLPLPPSMSIIVRAIYSLAQASLMASNFSECQFHEGGRLGLSRAVVIPKFARIAFVEVRWVLDKGRRIIWCLVKRAAVQLRGIC